MPKKMKKIGQPEIHKELKGFDIKVNEFGQLTGYDQIENLNQFLNGKVTDKKISNEEE